MRRAIAVVGAVAVLATLGTAGAKAEGRGFNPRPAPERYFSVNNRDRYVISLVRNSQGDIETYRLHAQRAAAVIARYTGISLVVQSGTVADGSTTDYQAGENQIVISIDATSPCGSNWDAGACVQAPVVKEKSPRGNDVYMVRSARIWLQPVTTRGATVYGLRHLVAHALGHAMGLFHYDETYEGKAQMMHSGLNVTDTDPAYGDYQTGDIKGFWSLHPYGRPWEMHPGTAVGDPDVASWTAGRLDLFVTGTDNALYHKFYANGSWSPFGSLGGFLLSSPTAVSWGPNRIDVFARSNNDELMHKWWDGNGWSGWEYLGGSIRSAPDVASWGVGRLDVFARGSSGQLVARSFVSGGWSPWYTFPGQILGGPSAVSWDVGHITVAARKPDKTLIFKTWSSNAQAWSEWAPVPSRVSTFSSSDPELSSWGPGALDLFVRDEGGYELLQYRARNGRWTGEAFYFTSRPVSSGAGAVSWGPNRIDLFTAPRGTTTPAHKWWDGYSW